MVYKIKQAIRRSINTAETFSGNIFKTLKRGYFQLYLKSYFKKINFLNSFTFSALYKSLHSYWTTIICKIPVIPLIMFFGLILNGCGSEYSEEQFIPEWNSEEGYRWAELPAGEGDGVGLEKLPSSYTNITLNNDLSDELMDQNRILMNGSGVAAGDIDGDGLVDLYFAKLDGPNALYKNLGGLQFEEITEDAGVGHDGHYSTGAVFADVNGNGHLDLLVTTMDSQNALYLNDGQGNFTLQENSGLGKARGSMTMALADINGDDYPDLYVVNYREINVIDKFDPQDLVWENTVVDGELIPPYDDYFTIIDRGEGFPPERHEIGRQDELYINNGDGSFQKTETPEDIFRDQNGDPLGIYPDWGLSAKFHDLNDDGYQDLYVSNDFWTPDRVWINQGDGTFRAIDSLAIRNSSYYSMTVDFSDISRNGYTDIFTVEMLNDRHSDRLRKRLPTEPIPLLPGEYTHRPRYNRNSLYLNRGDHTYAEISYYSGLEASNWSWTTRFLDIDLDGYEDLLINNGFAYDFQDMDSQQQLYNNLVETGGAERSYIEDFIQLKQQNRIYRNNGDHTFSEMSDDWGFTEQDISLGMALADLNGDGTQDVVISRMNDEPALYKNIAAGNRIAVRLKGKAPNTQAIGAKLTLYGGPVAHQTKQIFSGGDYLSGSDPMTVFGASSGKESHSLIIIWPDGTESRLDSLVTNRVYEIDQNEISTPDSTTASDQQNLKEESDISSPWFDDISDQLNHEHHEDEFDDFRIQPLLPKTLSQMGPGMAWLDLNGNGRDELIIGSGKGGRLGVFEVLDSGEFRPMETGLTSLPTPGDQTGIVGWRESGSTHLVIGNANYEAATIRTPSAFHIKLDSGQIAEIDSLPGVLSTTGPLAAADYNGDGSVDLFVGGRFIPGQYPRDASSRLFKNVDGTLVPDEQNSKQLENVGLVSGALFSDYDLDGDQDLILATEWGVLKLFQNIDGEFTDRTRDRRLHQHTGLWKGIAAGDFNEDGYPDYVATNLGENSPYRLTSPEHPVKIYYGDFNRDQRVDIIEAEYNSEIGGYVPRNNLNEYENISDILGHIQTHEQFSEMTIGEILQTDETRIPGKEVNTLQHMLFLNREGNGFDAVPLLSEAQLSSAFHAGVADVNNDGHEDLFISQNFFGVANPQQTPRLDAGRGLWMTGDGTGSFEAIPGHQSDVTVYGEQRGAALADFDRDGKVDLAVTQYAADSRLFHNRSDERGIVISLAGPPANESGIGSAVRLVYEDGTKGPLRSILAGSGYWSQNSAVQVLGFSKEPVAAEVTWHTGDVQVVDISEGQTEVVVEYE